VALTVLLAACTSPSPGGQRSTVSQQRPAAPRPRDYWPTNGWRTAPPKAEGMDPAVLAAIAGNVLSCSMAAYAFARLRFAFRRLWFAVMLATLMLPVHVLIIPQYTVFHRLGWIDSFLPLIVPKFLAVDGFFIFLMTQFIRSLPTELDDAARIDGCGPVRIYLRIILPLMRPALITTAIFTFVWTWDDFFGQLVYLNGVEHYTVPLALRSFLDSTGQSGWGQLLAMATLSLVPVLVFFLVFQRRITEGISTTGLHG